MPTYPKVAAGHNIPLIDLQDVPCRHDPVAPVDRQYSIAPGLSDNGLYTCFHFDFAEDEDDYLAKIGYFSLETFDTFDVTVYVRNTRMQWQRFNGVAQLPEMGQDAKWDNFFPRAIAVYVVDLEPLEEP